MLVPAFPVGHASLLKPALQTAHVTPYLLTTSQKYRGFASVNIERVKKKYHKAVAPDWLVLVSNGVYGHLLSFSTSA